RRERLTELVAADRQTVEAEPDRVEMPGVSAVGPLARGLDLLEIAEARRVARRHFLPPGAESVHLGELPETERRRDVRHVVLEAGRGDRIVPAAARAETRPPVLRHAVEAEAAHRLREAGVGGRRHAAFSRRDGLVRIEREARD